MFPSLGDVSGRRPSFNFNRDTSSCYPRYVRKVSKSSLNETVLNLTL